MDLTAIMWGVGMLIYAGLAGLAVLGTFCVLLLARLISRRRFRNQETADRFLQMLDEMLQSGQRKQAEELCSNPEYWYCAVPHLIRSALQQKKLKPGKVRAFLAMRFESDITGEMDNLMAWINTVVKSSPMVGLLGTVVGMIGAFGKLGFEGTSAESLGGEISIALFTTAIGLVIAVPLVLAANFLQVRIRKLEDATIEQLQFAADTLENANT